VSSPLDIERIRARAAELKLNPSAIDGFLQMDHETLILQAALWHQISLAHQNERLEIGIRSAEVIQELFDLCRERGIDVPDTICDAVIAIDDTPHPKA
jgi:hypothetical protein